MIEFQTTNIIIGRAGNGDNLEWDKELFPHMLIGGKSGSGKTTLLHKIARQAISNGDKVIILDPKRVSFSDLADELNSEGISSFEYSALTADMLNSLSNVKDELDARYAKKKEAGVNHFLSTSEDAYSIIVIIDEVFGLLVPFDGSIDPEINAEYEKENELKKQMLPLLARIGRLGRAAGIHLVLSTQKPASDLIPGELRANLDARVALGKMSLEDSEMILDSPAAAKLPEEFPLGIYKAGWDSTHFQI